MSFLVNGFYCLLLLARRLAREPGDGEQLYLPIHRHHPCESEVCNLFNKVVFFRACFTLVLVVKMLRTDGSPYQLFVIRTSFSKHSSK